MSSLYQTVKACIVKTPVSEQVEVVTKETESEVVHNPESVKENDAQDFISNKKTDEQSEQKPQAGIIWRVSSGVGSGLYNVTTGAVGYGVEQKPQAGIIWRVSSGVGSGLYNVTSGAVGYGVGGVKWAAGKSYEAGAAVASHVKVPSIPILTKKKDKKE